MFIKRTNCKLNDCKEYKLLGKQREQNNNRYRSSAINYVLRLTLDSVTKTIEGYRGRSRLLVNKNNILKRKLRLVSVQGSRPRYVSKVTNVCCLQIK